MACPACTTRSPWQVHEDFLRVMVAGVCELTYRLLPGMLDRGYGRIVNVASLAGLVPAPAGHALYGASKAFLIKFSEALSHEGRAHGVHVTALCPGFTLSEFHDVTGTREQMRGLPGWMWLDAATVAQQGYDAVMAGEAIHITGARQPRRRAGGALRAAVAGEDGGPPDGEELPEDVKASASGSASGPA